MKLFKVSPHFVGDNEFNTMFVLANNPTNAAKLCINQLSRKNVRQIVAGSANYDPKLDNTRIDVTRFEVDSDHNDGIVYSLGHKFADHQSPFTVTEINLDRQSIETQLL